MASVGAEKCVDILAIPTTTLCNREIFCLCELDRYLNRSSIHVHDNKRVGKIYLLGFDTIHMSYLKKKFWIKTVIR